MARWPRGLLDMGMLCLVVVVMAVHLSSAALSVGLEVLKVLGSALTWGADPSQPLACGPHLSRLLGTESHHGSVERRTCTVSLGGPSLYASVLQGKAHQA